MMHLRKQLCVRINISQTKLPKTICVTIVLDSFIIRLWNKSCIGSEYQWNKYSDEPDFDEL